MSAKAKSHLPNLDIFFDGSAAKKKKKKQLLANKCSLKHVEEFEEFFKCFFNNQQSF